MAVYGPALVAGLVGCFLPPTSPQCTLGEGPWVDYYCFRALILLEQPECARSPPPRPLPQPLARHPAAFGPYESDSCGDLESIRVQLLSRSVISSRSVLVVAGVRISFLHKAESHPIGGRTLGVLPPDILGLPSPRPPGLGAPELSPIPARLAPHWAPQTSRQSEGGAGRWRNCGIQFVPTSRLPVPQEGRHLLLGA